MIRPRNSEALPAQVYSQAWGQYSTVPDLLRIFEERPCLQQVVDRRVTSTRGFPVLAVQYDS
jgi:hypothetical protein